MTGVRRRRPRAVTVSSSRASGRAWSASRATCAITTRRCGRRRVGARGRHPHGRAVACAPRVRGASRDVRNQRHGHRQRARRRAPERRGCAHVNVTSEEGAMRIASGSGAIARPSRWAATTLLELEGRRGGGTRRVRARSSPTGGPRVSLAGAGNVIGGGDRARIGWCLEITPRPSPAARRACATPNSVRPWQHVLNPLSGYLSGPGAVRLTGATPRPELRPI